MPAPSPSAILDAPPPLVPAKLGHFPFSVRLLPARYLVQIGRITRRTPRPVSHAPAGSRVQ